MEFASFLKTAIHTSVYLFAHVSVNVNSETTNVCVCAWACLSVFYPNVILLQKGHFSLVQGAGASSERLRMKYLNAED